MDLYTFTPKKKNKPEKDSGYGQGEAFCIGCQHKWQAVAPAGTVVMECPNCKTMKGRYMFEFYPAMGVEVRACACDNRLFYLTKQGHLCANCGTYQRY